MTLLERGDTSPAALDRVARLPTVRVVIAKAALYDPRATEASYEAGLKALIKGGPIPPDDPFRFQRVRDRLPQVREMVARLERDPPAFGRDIVAMLAPYTPAGVRVDATVALVLGGTSDGWTEGGKTFYVAVDMLQGDYAGVVLLAAHELYHIAQGGFMPVVRSHAAAKNVAATENLLISTVSEGSAAYLADPLRVTNGGSYIAWFQEKYRANFRRLAHNFALLDQLLYRAWHDSTADIDELYLLGFSGFFESPGYFVGYRMAQQIDKYDGRAGLLAVYQQPPAEFFRRYLALAAAHSDDKMFIPFSAEVEVIVGNL